MGRSKQWAWFSVFVVPILFVGVVSCNNCASRIHPKSYGLLSHTDKCRQQILLFGPRLTLPYSGEGWLSGFLIVGKLIALKEWLEPNFS